MSNTDMDLSSQGVGKFSPAEVAELRRHMKLEETRARINAQTHRLTQICWTKCGTGKVNGGNLDRSEQTCLSNCVDRFLDLSDTIAQHLKKLGGT